MKANRAIWIATQRMQDLWGLFLCFRIATFPSSIPKQIWSESVILWTCNSAGLQGRERRVERGEGAQRRIIQKTREGCGCFWGLCGSSGGNFWRKIPRKLLDKFSWISKCLNSRISGTNLPQTLVHTVVGRCCRGALLETGSQDPVATRVPT